MEEVGTLLWGGGGGSGGVGVLGVADGAGRDLWGFSWVGGEYVAEVFEGRHFFSGVFCWGDCCMSVVLLLCFFFVAGRKWGF